MDKQDTTAPREPNEDARAPEPSPAPVPPAPNRMVVLVEDWFSKHFSNSAVSRSTDLFNHVHAAKEDLKRLITEHDK